MVVQTRLKLGFGHPSMALKADDVGFHNLTLNGANVALFPATVTDCRSNQDVTGVTTMRRDFPKGHGPLGAGCQFDDRGGEAGCAGGQG